MFAGDHHPVIRLLLVGMHTGQQTAAVGVRRLDQDGDPPPGALPDLHGPGRAAAGMPGAAAASAARKRSPVANHPLHSETHPWTRPVKNHCDFL